MKISCSRVKKGNGMGMFNAIYADLLYPVKNEIAKDTEIQIKWQKHKARNLSIYHLNDILEDLEDEFNNAWIRTDYICDICSKKTKGSGSPYVRVDDQQRHFVFVRIKNSKIEKILTEKEFKSGNVKDFVDYV